MNTEFFVENFVHAKHLEKECEAERGLLEPMPDRAQADAIHKIP